MQDEKCRLDKMLPAANPFDSVRPAMKSTEKAFARKQIAGLLEMSARAIVCWVCKKNKASRKFSCSLYFVILLRMVGPQLIEERPEFRKIF